MPRKAALVRTLPVLKAVLVVRPIALRNLAVHLFRLLLKPSMQCSRSRRSLFAQDRHVFKTSTSLL